MEDGIETNNQIINNLAISTLATYSMLDSDQIPANFWITNPDNIITGNHAAGSDSSGFWFNFLDHSTGASSH